MLASVKSDKPTDFYSSVLQFTVVFLIPVKT